MKDIRIYYKFCFVTILLTWMLTPEIYAFNLNNSAKKLSTNVFFGAPERVNQLKARINLQIKFARNEKNLNNLASLRQIFKGKADCERAEGEVLITAQLAPPEEPLSFPVSKWKKSWNNYLKSSKLIEAQDIEISRQARIITAGARDTWEATRRIVAWVSNHIDYQEGELKSAKQTLRSGKGNCTAMALLAVALCRTVKLPARLVSGYVYLENSFQAHAWLEVCVNAEGWRAFDPALGQIDFVDATHIGITTSTVWRSSLFGQNRIEILSYEPTQAGAIKKTLPVNFKALWQNHETRSYIVNDNGKNSGSYQATLQKNWLGDYRLTERLRLPDALTKLDSELILNKQGFAQRYHTEGQWCNQLSSWKLNYESQLKITGFLGAAKISEKKIPRINKNELQADLLHFAQWGLVLYPLASGITKKTTRYLTVYTPDTFAYTNLKVIIIPAKIKFQNQQLSGWMVEISGAQYHCKLELTKSGLLTRMELPEIQIIAKLKASSFPKGLFNYLFIKR